MNLAIAISTLIDLTSAAVILLNKTQQISDVIKKAQAEKRDVTQEEIDSIIMEDDAARIALNAAILKNMGH